MIPWDREHIITSRLLILQTKRLLLRSAQRQARRRDSEDLRQRVERLRDESEREVKHYHATLLRIGAPEHPDYWPAAYASLINLGHELGVSMRRTAAGPGGGAVAPDLEVMDGLMSEWRRSLRRSLVRS